MAASDPLVLGFDTSSHACRVALLRGDDVQDQRSEDMARGQAERLLGLCQEVLKAQGLVPADLAAIGVGTGPGNFTGIRIAVSAARGLALGLGIPAVGVTAFEALREGQTAACACAVPSRQTDVYFQAFDAAGAQGPPGRYRCDALPDHEGSLIGVGGIAPMFPTAVAICRVARLRYTGTPSRPAPLYLKAADAAPARDAGPRLLT